ncbi:unnamed protein product [Caretta caretta]
MTPKSFSEPLLPRIESPIVSQNPAMSLTQEPLLEQDNGGTQCSVDMSLQQIDVPVVRDKMPNWSLEFQNPGDGHKLFHPGIVS